MKTLDSPKDIREPQSVEEPAALTLDVQLGALLGCDVMVIQEHGLSVWDKSTMQNLLTESKVPTNLSAEWIVNRISKKAATSASVKARREIGIKAMKEGLAARGIGNGAMCYPTSFGFSVCNLFQDGIKAAHEIIEKSGIQHKRIEYSEMHWVVRVIL